MPFEDYGDMKPMVDDVVDASRRGVDVSLIYDRNYSYFDIATKRGIKGLRGLRRSVARLALNGVHLQNADLNLINPFAGRHHSKIYIFDDTILTAGGANLTNNTFRHGDYMLEYHSSTLADKLRNILPDLAADRPASVAIPLDRENCLLIDSGRRGDSIIVDGTVEALHGAKRAWYVSKILPTEKLYKAMNNCPDMRCFYDVPDPSRYSSIDYPTDFQKFPLPNLYNCQKKRFTPSFLLQSITVGPPGQLLGLIILTGAVWIGVLRKWPCAHLIKRYVTS